MSVATNSRTSPAVTSQNAYALRPATAPKKPRSPSAPRTSAIHQVTTFGGVSFIVASPLTSTSLRAGSDIRPGCGRVGQPAGGVMWRGYMPRLSRRRSDRSSRLCPGGGWRVRKVGRLATGGIRLRRHVASATRSRPSRCVSRPPNHPSYSRTFWQAMHPALSARPPGQPKVLPSVPPKAPPWAPPKVPPWAPRSVRGVLCGHGRRGCCSRASAACQAAMEVTLEQAPIIIEGFLRDFAVADL